MDQIQLDQTAAAAVPDGDQSQRTVGDEIHSTLVALLPWGISIVFHLGIVLLAIFIVWSTIRSTDDEQPIIPIARLSPTPGAPLQQKTPERVRSMKSTARRTVTPTAAKSRLLSKINTQESLIGVAGASKASPFDAAIAQAAGFSASFFGSGGNARRIIYIVDASGSLIDTLPFVILELKKSIQRLSEQQMFTVVFFQGDVVIEVPPPGMKQADADRKQSVSAWIDPSSHHIEPGGKSNPVSAIKLALRYKPQLLFLLSDNITGAGSGKYEIDQRRLLAEVNQANTSGTKINTIQFLYRDPLTDAGLEGTMKLIAERSGGEYKFVDGKELNLE